MTPGLLRELAGRGLVRQNYRGVEIPTPAGVVIVLTAIIVLAPILVVAILLLRYDVGWDIRALNEYVLSSLLFVIGVGFLGLLDDLLGSARTPEGDRDLPRGWRGHARAAARGRISTGALKAGGTLALALVTLSPLIADLGEFVVGVLLLVTTTNLFNLLDLRPGRSIKALILLGAGLSLAYGDLEPITTFGLFLGPILVLFWVDLRELGMLGDTGANVIGAVAGLWMVTTMPFAAQIGALVVVLFITVYGEFRSISALIEKTPGLRQLDSIGRAHA
jgi:UDP-N-acetylmuramyl pentapeptide phosphotransferase/UDP-N-acetylglucosamine-1-phosphate transferase